MGDLDDTDLIEREARDTDIALHLAATGHIASATAISQGLSKAQSKSPKHWIQMSGATLLAAEIAQSRFGFKAARTFDDLNDIQDVMSIIRSNPKRAVDNLVISQDSSKVKTALIVGPLIYGVGRGPVNTRSVQAPEIARVTLEQKEGFRLAEGENSWSNVHVHDLSGLIVALVDAAVNNRPGLWNENGIYFPENGNMVSACAWLKFPVLLAKYICIDFWQTMR